MKEHLLGAANPSVRLVVGAAIGVILAMAVVVPFCLDVSFPPIVAGAWLWGRRGTNAVSRLLATSRWTVNRFRRHRFVRTAAVAICPGQPLFTHFHSTQSLAATETVLPVHFFSYACPSCSKISLGSESLWSITSIAVKFDGQDSPNIVWFGQSRCFLLSVHHWVLATVGCSLEPVGTLATSTRKRNRQAAIQKHYTCIRKAMTK